MPDARKTSARKMPKKAASKKKVKKSAHRSAPQRSELVPEDFLSLRQRSTDPRDEQEPLPTPPWRSWNVPPYEHRTQHDFYAPPPDSPEYREFQAYVEKYRRHPDFWKAMAELRVPSSKTLNWQSSREFDGGSDLLWNSIIEAYPEPVPEPEPEPVQVKREPAAPVSPPAPQRRFSLVHKVAQRVRSLV